MTNSNLKHSFRNDYSELAHPRVLEALSAVGTRQFEGYGLDDYSLRAADMIKAKISLPGADVHFISGGTHANLVVLSSILRPHEAVIAPAGGHISQHESGAIEATGHKICVVKNESGKLNAEEILAVVHEHDDEHMVSPRIVYISQSTENGTVYTGNELTAIFECCRSNGLYLYIDGARMGAAVNSHASDLSYGDIAALADVFYIGGTKNGALFGEAIVICNEHLKVDFRVLLKQRGGLLAKGAAIGIQFEALMKDGLYDELAVRANSLARRMADGIRSAGYGFLHPVETNQIFPVFPSNVISKLHDQYGFYDWQKSGDMTAVRLVVSWATPDSIVEEFIEDLRGI